MICYNEEHRAFALHGKAYSYIMYVGEAGFLQQMYYGSRIEAGDIPFLKVYYGQPVSPKSSDFNMDERHDRMPGECGFYARGDYREPTVIARRADGAAMSRLRYVSHEIRQGTAELPGLPHAHTGGQTLSILLKDDFSHLSVKLNYTAWDDSNVLARNLEIINGERAHVTLTKAFSFALDLPAGDYETLCLVGRWGQERTPEREKLGRGIRRFQSLRGISSHEMNPFVGILEPDCAEHSGKCYGVQLVYSGSFAITAESFAEKPVRIQGGIGDVGFEWSIPGADSFVTPQALLCYSEEGVGGMSRSYADFIRDHILPPKFAYARRPVVVNNWEATYFDFSNEKLLPMIDEAAKLGIDTFVLDDGWFGKRNDDNCSLGDWYVNTEKLEGGLTGLIDRCRKNGLKFGIWIEPEMVCEDSDLYRAHPDWAVGKPGNEPSRKRNQLVLDMTRREVVEHVFRTIEKLLKENDIRYVKWDMNRSITDAYSCTAAAQEQGRFYHRYMLGVYELARRLTTAFPEVFFEGCSSGGARFDAGMLYYFPQIWTSDDTDGYERTKIQWGTATCYPQSAMSCHVSACPNHQTGRTTSMYTRGVIASMGATGYELDLSKLTAEERQEVARQTAHYDRIVELVMAGDSYRLCDPFQSNYFCQMLVSKDKTRAYVCGECIHAVPYAYDQRVHLVGLAPEKMYRIEELDMVASGKVLVQAGLLLPHLRDFSAWTWHIEAVS